MRWEKNLNPEMVGCYTSMIRVKQGYRALENDLTHKGKQIPIQAERPYSNITMDWRKRVAFHAKLEPGMNRFDVRLTRLPTRPQIEKKEEEGFIRICGEKIDWAIDTQTGLIGHFRVDGREIVRTGAFQALLMHDTPDPWGMTTDRFDKITGRFQILSPQKSAEVSGVSDKRQELKTAP